MRRVAALDGTSKVSNLLDRWERESPSGTRLLDLLTELAEMLERANEIYYKMDRDPFDTRHPSRAYPDCAIGHMLKRLFRHEAFIDALISYIVDGNNGDIHTVACRIMIDMSSGVDPRSFTEKERLISKLFEFAEKSPNPLRSYATGILAVAMEENDTAAKFKDQNTRLVPLMLERLNDLSYEYCGRRFLNESSPVRHFQHLSCTSDSTAESKPSASVKRKRESVDDSGQLSEPVSSMQRTSLSHQPRTDLLNSNSQDQPLTPILGGEHSNSSWSDMEALVIGSYQVFPLTKADEQSYIIQYLTSLGEYQELLTAVFARPLEVLRLILKYINLQEHSDVRLAFNALKYLAALLCHKKCVNEFMTKIGIESILKVHRSSLAATGVSFVLFNLSCNDDVLQTICLFDRSVVKELVSYTLSLIERSHQSGQCYATMFFQNTIKHRIIREIFDEFDGLRKVLNLASTLEIVTHNLARDFSGVMSPDQVFSSRQLCRHVAIAINRYFEAHAEAKAMELLREHGQPTFANRPLKDNMQTLLEFLPPHAVWKPVNQLLKLDGISFCLKLIAMHFEWIYPGKIDTVRSALDTLYICSIMNKVKLALCNEVQYRDIVHSEVKRVGMSIILKSALPDKFNADAQCSALNIIINCVCRPPSADLQSSCSVSKKKSQRNEEDNVNNRIFNCVRANDGIMILKSLMTTKSPVSDADSIRALACQALCGLSRCDKVVQIVSKLPLLTTGQLQVLMREPVFKDKRAEHAKFVKYCKILIGMVAGRSLHGMEALLSNINKAEIVAETVVTYDEKQLLYLVCEHLKEKGFYETARCLQNEANLKSEGKPVCNGYGPPQLVSQRIIKNQHSSCFHKKRDANSSFSINESFEFSPHSDCSTPKHPSDVPTFSTPSSHSTCVSQSSQNALPGSSPGYPTKLVLKRKRLTPRTSFSETRNIPHTSIEKEISAQQFSDTVSLHTIVTEYLRNQHARCTLPFVTCPPFDLFQTHQCPEQPQYNRLAPKNITLHILQKQKCPLIWGHLGERISRKYLSCRFREVNSYCDSECVETIFSCAFDPFNQVAYAGVYSGSVVAFPKASYDPDGLHSNQCHESLVSNIKTTKHAKLVLTSASPRRPTSCLWDSSNAEWVLQHTFAEDSYVEFSKLSCDRIVATCGNRHEKTKIYDTATGSRIATLSQPNLGSNEYTNNRATFNYTDELVLSDGVIWDVRHNVPIHKLDKLNRIRNGIFHPNGLEIISNTEIWDLRTYRLLRTVPELEQCEIVFDQPGHVFYGVVDYVSVSTGEPSYRRYGKSIRTFDATDYTCTATKDVQRHIRGIALDYDDRYLAVIQNRMLENSTYREESMCRIYEVGRFVESDDEDGRDVSEEDDDVDDSQNLEPSDDNDDDNANDDSYEEDMNDDDDDDTNDSDDDIRNEMAIDDGSSSDSSSEHVYFTVRS